MATREEDDPGAGRAPLTRDRVVAAALALADDGGIGAVTMRKVAEGVGVEAMSLYHHVANKEDLLDGMVDAVFAEIDLPDEREPWRSAMRRRAVSARAALTRHPWAVGLMDSRSSPGPGTLRHHDAVIGNLRAAGFTIAQAATAFSLLDSYLYGYALQEASLPFGDDGIPLEELGDALLAELPAAAYPHVVEMVTEHALRPGYDHGAEFERGLDLVLDGLERLLADG